MYAQRILVNDLQNARGTYDGAQAYARTKRGQVILTQLWAEALAPRGMVVHAMHPGWADTPGFSANPSVRQNSRDRRGARGSMVRALPLQRMVRYPRIARRERMSA